MNYNRIIVLLTCLMLAITMQSCAKRVKDSADVSANERALVINTIPDADRVSQFLALLDDRDRLISEQSELRRNYKESMQMLNSDYSAEREAFNSLLTNYREQSVDTLRLMVAQIEQMKSLTTPAEWAVIADFQLENQPRSRLLN